MSFAANGRCHIHLTGYLNEDFTDLEEEEVDEEEEEEKEGVFKTSTKRTKSVENGRTFVSYTVIYKKNYAHQLVFH